MKSFRRHHENLTKHCNSFLLVVAKFLILLKMLCDWEVLICKNTLNFLKNVYLRDRVQVGERQRERETHDPKQAPGSELSAQSLIWGLKPQTMRS